MSTIRGLPQIKRTTGKMHIISNPHKKAKCKICGFHIFDCSMVVVDGYITGYGKTNYFYYHIDCVRNL